MRLTENSIRLRRSWSQRGPQTACLSIVFSVVGTRKVKGRAVRKGMFVWPTSSVAMQFFISVKVLRVRPMKPTSFTAIDSFIDRMNSSTLQVTLLTRTASTFVFSV